MLDTGWFTAAEDWVETHVLSAHDFATFGFAMALLLCLGLVFLFLSGVRSLITRLRNASGTRAFRRSKEPGYRILLARPTGSGAGRIGKWLNAALSDNLAEFNFGAPFRLALTGEIAGGSDQKVLAQARRRLAASKACRGVAACGPTRLARLRSPCREAVMPVKDRCRILRPIYWPRSCSLRSPIHRRSVRRR